MTSAWIQTFTGIAFFPLDPRIEDISIVDIGWALSNQCRYAGHTADFYSVAEHSVLLSHAVPAEDALAALCHDLSEAYLTDIPRPLKPFLPQYKEAEDRLMQVIAWRFNFPWPMPASVKEADGRILVNEREALHRTPPHPWEDLGPALPNVTIRRWPPRQAYQEFMQRFNELTKGKRW